MSLLNSVIPYVVFKSYYIGRETTHRRVYLGYTGIWGERERELSYCSLGSDVSAAHDLGSGQWLLSLGSLPE